MFREAFLAALAYFICYGGNWLLGQCMIERPIIVGLVTGILMGDIPTGVMIGAALEAIFMGAVNIGGAISAEPASATVFATTFAIVLNINAEAAYAIAIPIGIVAAFVMIFINNVAMNIFAPLFDKLAAEGNEKGITSIHYFMWFVKYLIPAIIVFLGVLAGSGPVESFMNNIPDVLMRAFQAVGGFLPAVGFSILLKMLWSKELAVYFFLGFILVAYLELPLIAIAVLGVIIAIVTALRDKEMFDMSNNAKQVESSTLSDEEDFFS